MWRWLPTAHHFPRLAKYSLSVHTHAHDNCMQDPCHVVIVTLSLIVSISYNDHDNRIHD